MSFLREPPLHRTLTRPDSQPAPASGTHCTHRPLGRADPLADGARSSQGRAFCFIFFFFYFPFFSPGRTRRCRSEFHGACSKPTRGHSGSPCTIRGLSPFRSKFYRQKAPAKPRKIASPPPPHRLYEVADKYWQG